MKRLINNGDVILDGTLTREEKEKEAFEKLETIEELIECYEIDSLLELRKVLFYYWAICHLKNFCKNAEILRNSLNDKND